MNKAYSALPFICCSFLIVGCAREVFTGKREARGVWVSRFEYTNDKTRKNPELAKERIRTLFAKARKAKFNMVFFQVRGNADAFYHSQYEPWSQLLTDTLGKDPGWDPLQFAIDEAHEQGLELHAWINTFPIWHGTKHPPVTNPPQPYAIHPEWSVCDSQGRAMTAEPATNDYVWASPGIPAVRQHVINVVNDIVDHYDIDGIHFDYVRYPEGAPQKGYSHDSISVARFNSVEGNPNRLSWEHWQREQVSQFIFDSYNWVMSKKPWVKMSAAVIGKYSGLGWTSYNIVYQDPRRWMEVGKIDFIVPMVYWERAHPTHPFVPLITEWHDRVAYDRHVVPGLASRLIDKYGWEEIAAEIKEVRRNGLAGVVFFSASGLEKAWDLIGVDAFPYWSNVPRLAWKDSIPPPPPVDVRAEPNAHGVMIRWQSPAPNEPLVYNIYRSQNAQISADDVFLLVHITPRNATQYLDDQVMKENSKDVYYALSAVDRLGNESEISSALHVRVFVQGQVTMR